MMHRLLLLLLFTLCASPLCIVAQTTSETAPPPLDKLPLTRVGGKPFDFKSVQNQVVLLSFGATWCAPCAVELKALEELKSEYANQPIKFLWISVEDEKQASDALLRHYARERRLTMPVLRDEKKAAYKHFSERVRLPLVVIYDAAGRFVAQHVGMGSPEIYKLRVREKLNETLKQSQETLSSR